MEIIIVKDLPFDQNSYIVVNEKKAYIIDPGYSFEKINEEILKKQLVPKAILLTHFHFDHVAGVNELAKKYNIKAFIHKKDLEFLLEDTLAISFGFQKIEIDFENVIGFETKKLTFDNLEFLAKNMPGHSEGSTIFLIDNNVFTGDVLFIDSIGRTDLIGSDSSKMRKTLKKIKETFCDKFIIYPGHGKYSNFDDVKKVNPFLK